MASSLEYFDFPTQCRTAIAGGTALHTGVFGDNNNPEPQIIGMMRKYRKQMKTFDNAVVRRDVGRARKVYKTAKKSLQKIQNKLQQAQVDLTNAQSRYSTISAGRTFPDAGLPTIAADGSVAPAYQQKYAEIRTWVASLPEIVYAVETLRSTTFDLEIEQMLKPDRKEDRPDPLPDLDDIVIHIDAETDSDADEEDEEEEEDDEEDEEEEE